MYKDLAGKTIAPPARSLLLTLTHKKSVLVTENYSIYSTACLLACLLAC